MTKTHSTEYTVNHDVKRKAKRKEFKFYLDDADEARAYELLQEAQERDKERGSKGLVIDAILAYKNNLK